MSVPGLAERDAAGPRAAGLLIAAVVGAVAIAGGIGAFALSFGGKAGSDAPVIVKADNAPIKVRPENPGGTVVPNQDNKVYDAVEGHEAGEPVQEKLVTNIEEPVDVSGRAVCRGPDADPRYRWRQGHGASASDRCCRARPPEIRGPHRAGSSGGRQAQGTTTSSPCAAQGEDHGGQARRFAGAPRRSGAAPQSAAEPRAGTATAAPMHAALQTEARPRPTALTRPSDQTASAAPTPKPTAGRPASRRR